MTAHSRQTKARRCASERGAILIQVAVASLVLIAFTMFVVDYGILWVSRRQAQNAADAGAMAGAIALAFDNFSDRSDTGPAKTAAYTLATFNEVWEETPDVNITTDVTFPPCPDDGTDTCIRVDAYRNQDRGNPLPVWFGQLVMLTEQGVRATATAQVAVANASECLKPWALPDKWEDWDDSQGIVENPPQTWTDDDEYHTKVEQGPSAGLDLTPPDYYRKQGTNGKDDVGTGFRLIGEKGGDYGLQVRLKFGNGGDAIEPGNFLPIVLPNADASCSVGGSCYQTNIATCNGVPISVGDKLTTEPGAKVGPTAHGMEDLIALDPYAEWDSVNEEVINSCVQDEMPCASYSPRIVAVPVYDTNEWYDAKLNGRNNEVTVVNILGFFLDRMVGNDVIGYFVKMPGLSVSGKGSVAPEASFLKSIQLVR